MRTRSRIALTLAFAAAMLLSSLALMNARAADEPTPADNGSATRYKPANSPTAAAKKAQPRTILPFPVPGDTSEQAVRMWRMLNLPRTGRTTVAPLPPPGSKSTPAPAFSHEAELKVRMKLHQTDCDDENIELPEPIAHPDPVLPKGVKREDAKGIFRVYTVVDEAGRVVVAETRGSATPLDSAAVECVRTWRFKPAMHCGHAFPTVVMVPVRFDGK